MNDKELLSVLRNQFIQVSFGPMELMLYNTVLVKNISLNFKHVHNHFELHMLLCNDATFVVDGEEVEVRSGQLCWINPGFERHVKNDPLKEMKHFIIHFDLVESPNIATDLPKQVEVKQFISSIFRQKYWVCDDENRCAEVYNLICTEMANRKFGYMLKIRNFLSSFIVAAIQSIGIPGMLTVDLGQGGLAYDILLYVRTHYNEGLSLADVATALNVSPRHITRLLRETFGTTYNKILVSFQVEHAKMLLSNPDLTLGQIAEQVGFSSAGVLRDNFFKYTGEAVGAYRSKLRDKSKTAGNAPEDKQAGEN